LKIATGFEIKENSWEGGNQFSKTLIEASIKECNQITYGLKIKILI
tara:strand:- start:5 stop:142 length:138 start_codon:yes stop_codon:yes gene_type:complete